MWVLRVLAITVAVLTASALLLVWCFFHDNNHHGGLI